MGERFERVLVTGATGFVGRALRPALLARGHELRAASRRRTDAPFSPREHWVRCDVLQEEQLGPALEGMDAAYYLVHSMGAAHEDFRALERRSARAFVRAAESAGLRRIVYLGGVAPRETPSPHLASRLEVGDILRSGRVPVVELRASMIIGPGSTSWQICRDLALRLPLMVLPAWMKTRSCPIALEDAVQALTDALDIPLPASAWFDIPGPECLSGRDILQRTARLYGRRVVMVDVPFLTPRLSSLWLRLVTRADFPVARELVRGLTGDLLPRDARYYALTGHPPRLGFEAAARTALAAEPAGRPRGSALAGIEERLVLRLGPPLLEGTR
ncbi:NAD(P)H-binding protein [Myxococcus sp. RHSTA-1-4]|uniref:NAD(P)H-binding protein n=1 Tax=Myxococcus sp. RHSTA-1-4 TaxID=2874601 RepID=UPI001CBCFF99|nr:NAD(P)H-binding protein [Myxococcus sp. RHSTA-1-4]MBZ4420651.1 NAD(P)H-binding protein [Myxococcus sp. RHSTA-1-4]